MKGFPLCLLFDLFRHLQRLLLLLHLADFGQYHLAEDSALHRARELALAGFLFRRGGLGRGRLGLAGGGDRVGGEIGVLRVVFLNLERLDAIGQLDDFDATAQARLGDVGLDFGQQVVVGSILTA